MGSVTHELKKCLSNIFHNHQNVNKMKIKKLLVIISLNKL